MMLFMQCSGGLIPLARAASHDAVGDIETMPNSRMQADAVEFARCFLRLANLPISRSIASAGMKQTSGIKPAHPLCAR